MNSTWVKLKAIPVPAKIGIVSDYDFVTVDMILASCIIIISLVGVITNSINIRTFIYMGLDDGITISLFGLALSDFGFSFFSCIAGGANLLSGFEVRYGLRHLPVAPRYLVYVFAANLGLMFYMITCMTTTFIAVARCMCVAMPFQFKNFFTRTKSTSGLIIFTLFGVASYLPLLVIMGAQYRFDPRVNTTRFVLWISSNRSEIKMNVTLIHMTFTFISAVVVTICIFIMAKHLKQSGKFRQASTARATESDGNEKQQYKLSGKELQVVKQVVVICTIYSVCLVPMISMVIYRLLNKEFDFGKGLHNLYDIFSSTLICVDLINSATTFPVYYVYNSKFRTHCWSTSRSIKVKASNESGGNK